MYHRNVMFYKWINSTREDFINYVKDIASHHYRVPDDVMQLLQQHISSDHVTVIRIKHVLEQHNLEAYYEAMMYIYARLKNRPILDDNTITRIISQYDQILERYKYDLELFSTPFVLSKVLDEIAVPDIYSYKSTSEYGSQSVMWKHMTLTHTSQS